MQPAVAKPLHKAGGFHAGQDRPFAIAAHAGGVFFAQPPQLQDGPLEGPGGLLQGLLQLLRGCAVRHGGEASSGGESIPRQVLHSYNIFFQSVHSSAAFLLARRSVGDVVIASYSFAVAWNWIGTWL